MDIEPSALPYRGEFGAPRPLALAALPLPPAPMPSHRGGRPLKAWRYVGVYAEELMMCAGAVRIGPARQAFWAVWDRERGVLRERTTIGRGAVLLERGRARVLERDVQLDVRLDETAGIESICPSGAGYAWTRKQGGIDAAGVVVIDGSPRPFKAAAVIDDTAAYYQRHTSWRWSAGVGLSTDGRRLAWNLVSGVNDPPHGSERTVWVDGVPAEAPVCAFASDLSSVESLVFEPEATRERRDNLVLIRSSYRQPFGTFSGAVPGGVALAAGYGVMEEHDVWW